MGWQCKQCRILGSYQTSDSTKCAAYRHELQAPPLYDPCWDDPRFGADWDRYARWEGRRDHLCCNCLLSSNHETESCRQCKARRAGKAAEEAKRKRQEEERKRKAARAEVGLPASASDADLAQRKAHIQAFPEMSSFGFSTSLEGVVQALSTHGIATQRDLRYIGSPSLNDLFTSQGTPLTQEDKSTIQQLRQRLVEEEKQRITKEAAELLKMKELTRVTKDAAEILKKKVVEAAREKAKGDASRKKAAQERAARAKKEEEERQQEESNLRREEGQLEKSRKKLEEDKVVRQRPLVEAKKVIDLTDAEKKRAESEKQTKGPQRYKAFFGKCNHTDCRKSKGDHFGPDMHCHDPQVLDANVAGATAKFTQEKAAAAAVQKDPTFVAAEAKTKQEEKAQKDQEAAFEAKKKAATATAKKKAEERTKETQEADAAAKKDSDSKAKTDAEAASAIQKHEAAVNIQMHAEYAAKASADAEAKALRSFFKRAPTATASTAASAVFPSWQALALPDEDLVKLTQLFVSLGFTQESHVTKLDPKDIQSLQVAPSSMDKIRSFVAKQAGVAPSRPTYDATTGLPGPNEFADPPQSICKNWPDGKQYRGEMLDGRRHGKGSITYPDGASYDGDWHNDWRHGHGEYKYTDGTWYKGAWEMGNRQGDGLCTYADGNMYQGNWVSNLPHGKGQCRFAEGSLYRGEFVMGKMHGFGTLIRHDGSVAFEGEWREGEKAAPVAPPLAPPPQPRTAPPFRTEQNLSLLSGLLRLAEQI
jgi:hypothetical protein